jgi:hypothetical protein
MLKEVKSRCGMHLDEEEEGAKKFESIPSITYNSNIDSILTKEIEK